jgi:hypothetical protein
VLASQDAADWVMTRVSILLASGAFSIPEVFSVLYVLGLVTGSLCSHMLGCSDNFAPDFFPINAIVQLLIHKPNYCDIVASDKVQAMANL